MLLVVTRAISVKATPGEKTEVMLLVVTRAISVKATWCLVVHLFVLLLVINYIRGNFTCNSTNVIYLAECINCKCQYVGSATCFK